MNDDVPGGSVADRPNVLITSASRKVLLVEAFRDAVARLGGGRVIAADVDPLAAALYAADDARIVPRSDEPAFVDALLRICSEDAVGLVVPTRDEELPVLARAHDRFADAGALVLVSPADAVEACQDKVRFAAAVRAAGLETAEVFLDPASARYPAFVRPRRGKGGVGTARVDDAVELRAALENVGGDAIVQAFVDAPEYTIDVFIDPDGRPLSCVPRERLAVVAGESVVGRTVHDAGLSGATLRLCDALGLVGHVTVQAFRSTTTISFIEINPRYGGAANLGFAAGAPTPEFALRVARGEHVPARVGEHVAGLVMLRHAADLFVRESDLVRIEPRR